MVILGRELLEAIEDEDCVEEFFELAIKYTKESRRKNTLTL